MWGSSSAELKWKWRAGGVYYRGLVNDLFQQQPELEAAEELWAAYDPWEAVEVAWDGKSGSYAGARAVCDTQKM